MVIISSDDILEEMEKVIGSKLQVNRVIPINSVALYIAIEEYEQGITTDEVEVNINYKTMDKKVKLWLVPCLKIVGSE